MPSTSGRLFESAEEIFQAFAPDYHPVHQRTTAAEFLLGKRGGADLARKVLEQFRGSMAKAKATSGRSSRAKG